jgi:hypothetical protein
MTKRLELAQTAEIWSGRVLDMSGLLLKLRLNLISMGLSAVPYGVPFAIQITNS